MTTLVLATRNFHKIEEIRNILGAGFRYLTLTDWPNAPVVIEDAPTFQGNAGKKAIELARWLSRQDDPRMAGQNFLVLADDSGLEVDALNGAPGVHSARFAALDSANHGNARDGDNNAKLLRLLRGVPADKRTARFRCVIALTPVFPNRIENASPVCYADELELQTELFDGVCEGRIATAPRGAGGFGYDPLFVPEGFTQSYAELGEQTKNSISHRARALEKLRARLTGNRPMQE
jgi:XTP/dITP diphosphohydrolase